MKLLVTGGTGFIGSHLAEEGRRRGAEVVVLGLTDRPEERANTELLRRQGVEVLGGSITDEALCRRAVQGATHVFHLAVAMREGGEAGRVLRDGQSRGDAAAAGGLRRRKRPAVRLLQHDRDLRAPRARRHYGGDAARAREHLRANQGLGRGPGSRGRRGPRIAVRDPAARRRLRAARPAPAEAVRRGEPGPVSAVRSGRRAAAHGLRGRRGVRLLQAPASGTRRWVRRSSSPGRGPAPCAS